MKTILLSKLKENKKNPRIIKDDKFFKLVNSIKEFPKMMELRPIVVDNNMTPLGGNMRLKALKELGYKEIPENWVKKASDLTEEEQKRFVIADNVSFGEWDWEMLANEWNHDELEEWEVELHLIDDSEVKKPQQKDLIPYKKTHVLLSFSPEKLMEIQHLLEQILAFDGIEYEQASN